jgi:diguanylate cyclase (GGDEF)-like protein
VKRKLQALTLRDLLVEVQASTDSLPRIPVGSTLREAAAVLADSETPVALVVDGESVIGQIDCFALLREVSQDIDPTTSLPRSGPLRDWLRSKVLGGKEVAVVFLDVDRFAEINASGGHTEGDRVLAKIAEALVAASSHNLDFCSRFGGDEFAIATLRPRAEAENWAHEASCALVAIGVQASFGISGGRRGEPREEVNVSSMVEELLRLASLDCMAMKNKSRHK